MATDRGLILASVGLAMTIEEARARVAAYNIAMANMPGSKAIQLDATSSQMALRASQHDPFAFAQALKSVNALGMAGQVSLRSSNPVISLDSEVADMSAASGRYQALADGVSRQFALMQLAIRGGR